MNDNHASMREQGNVYSLPGPLAAGNKPQQEERPRSEPSPPMWHTKRPNNKEDINKIQQQQRRLQKR